MFLENIISTFYNGTHQVPDELLKMGRSQLERIEGYVFLAPLLLAVLVVFGSTRRRFNNPVVKFAVWVAYAFTSLLVSYALGLMQSFSFRNDSFTFWATFLLIALAKADCITAFSLGDNESGRRYLLEAMLQLYWVSYLIPCYNPDQKYRAALSVLSFMAWMKSVTTAEIMKSASKSGLERNTKLTADFMSYEHDFSEQTDVNPVTMAGYNYLVRGDDEEEAQIIRPLYRKRLNITDKVITVQKIWQCKGRLLSSTSGHSEEARRKDLCLSHALFRIICCRFAGYSLPASTLEKNWNLVRNGLVSEEGGDQERAFRIIEVELGFLYDFFYTKYPSVIRKRQFLWRVIELVIVAFGCWAAVSTLSHVKITEQYMALSTNSRHSIDMVVTVVVITAILMMEFVQLFYIVTSDWMKVKCLCRYVREESWQDNKWIEKTIEIICMKQWKPWERKLGQYSPLESFCYTPSRILYNCYVSLAIDKPREGQKQSKQIGLPEQVEVAIIDSLKRNGRQLSKGAASLRRNGVENLLCWACELETSAHVILVWHIATSICEMELAKATTREAIELRNSDKVIVANCLSKYCAYLMAFLPKFLPDHSYITEFIFDQVIVDARELLKGYKTNTSKYNRMKELGRQDHQNTIIEMGAKLGKSLVEEIGHDLRWKALADFWAELILFMAPSEEVTSHAEQLANGGEFMTHLWALLFHAGIVTRNSASLESV